MRPTALVSRDRKAQGEHDNCAARYERRTDIRAFPFAIRIDSIRYANRFESIRFVKKSAFRFTSRHAVFALNK